MNKSNKGHGRLTKGGKLSISAYRKKNKGGMYLQRWRDRKSLSKCDDEDSRSGSQIEIASLDLTLQGLKTQPQMHQNDGCAINNTTSMSLEEPSASGTLLNVDNNEPSFELSDNIEVAGLNKSNLHDAQNLAEIAIIEPPTGYRMYEMKHLVTQLQSFGEHRSIFGCSSKNMVFVYEDIKGHHSVMHFKCNMCGASQRFENESQDETTMDINTAMVFGTVCTGQGYSQLNERSAIANMPSLSKDAYNILQNKIYRSIHEIAQIDMAQAADEEIKLARASSDVDKDGIPLITVVVDGAWAKRSYRCNYNSLSGVACIVGYRTGKVLFVGIRNMYCSICTRAENKQKQVPEHTCYKNWEKSPNSMEADIIAEGFKCSLDMYGIKYARIIGDGDSSVLDKLTKIMPYGLDLVVQKIECTNHVCRNYSNRLRDLSTKRQNNVGIVPVVMRNLLKNNLDRLRTCAISAISHRSKEVNLPLDGRIRELTADLRNGPFHVFGKHSNCEERGYFCKRQNDIESNHVDDLKLCGLWNDLMSAVNILVHHAPSLIHNVTNNMAERYNSIIVKFTGGKRVNFTQRGSYQARCKAAVASYNNREHFYENVNKHMTNGGIGKYTTTFVNNKARENVKRSARRLDKGRERKKRRYALTTGADEHYGRAELGGDIPDMSREEFESKRIMFLNSLMKTQDEIDEIENLTKQQSLNATWKAERLKRLTASNYGQICRMRSKTPRAGLVSRMLYSTFSGSSATKWGIEKEPIARKEYEECSGKLVQTAGFFIDQQQPFLGASPDGLLEDDGLIEIKCPSSAKDLTPQEAIRMKIIKFCTLESNETDIKLKRNDPYYYQVQGQLHITQRSYCIFIVWTQKGLAYEKICRDDTFWSEQMAEKLQNFYYDCLLPELIDARYTRGLPIREPLQEATEKTT